MPGVFHCKLTKIEEKSLLDLVTWRLRVSTSCEEVAGCRDLRLIPILQMVTPEHRAVQWLGLRLQSHCVAEQGLEPRELLSWCSLTKLACLLFWEHRGNDKGTSRREYANAWVYEATLGRANSCSNSMLLWMFLYHSGYTGWWPTVTKTTRCHVRKEQGF